MRTEFFEQFPTVRDLGEYLKSKPEMANTTAALQAAVGGYIERCPIATDAAVLCNEEGLLHDLPYNCKVCGRPFVGTILIVGTGSDKFSSVPITNLHFWKGAII